MSVQRNSVFGTGTYYRDMLDERCVSMMLARRITEKCQNYDRAASRLELRGEADAAKVLRRAAERLRRLNRG